MPHFERMERKAANEKLDLYDRFETIARRTVHISQPSACYSPMNSRPANVTDLVVARDRLDGCRLFILQNEERRVRVKEHVKLLASDRSR